MHRPEIFIHVGMGRAGSTFLQYRVFPKIKGLRYIQRTEFRKAGKIIARGKHGRYLVSGELDPRFIENYLREFCVKYSFAKPIIVIRRHDEWIASQFRRYLKNGNHWTFRDFFDLENNRGYWKKDSLYYFPVIELLEKYFDHRPLVLLYDNLRNDPVSFIRSILDFMHADIDIDRVDMSPKHASYREKQLRAVYTVSGRFNLRKKRPFTSKWKNVFLNLGINGLRYGVLYLSGILPENLIPAAQIFPAPEQLAAIKEAYDADWKRCREYAMGNP